MQLSNRTRHGTRLLMNLAHFSKRGPLRASSLSNNIGISIKYLEKIIKPLRQAGIIRGLRGPGGGYYLGRSPEKITLGEIIQALDGGAELTCCADHDRCNTTDYCGAPSLWAEVSSALQGKLNSITLDGMMRQDPLFASTSLMSGFAALRKHEDARIA